MKQYQNTRGWIYHKYWVMNLSMSEIAQICKVSTENIRRCMVKFKIKRRTISEAHKGKCLPHMAISLKVWRDKFNPNDIIEKKFGMLKVIKLKKTINKAHFHHGKYSNKYLYLCECACGNTKIINRRGLIGGITRNCGCITKEKWKFNRGLRRSRKLPKGESSFRTLLSHYKEGAERRNLNWDLSKEEFHFLTKQNCFYCGKSPIQEILSCKQANGSYFYNGLDRIDSNKGYTKENSVPCCKICNRSKSDLTYNEFIAWIKRVNQFIEQ